jgi:hypothetical protein
MQEIRVGSYALEQAAGSHFLKVFRDQPPVIRRLDGHMAALLW